MVCFTIPGVFTFSETAVFFPGQGCVQLTRQLKKSTYPFPPPFLSILPISHSPIKLCQNYTQFTKNTQNHFDTDFDKTLVFPSKNKFSDNLKSPIFTTQTVKNISKTRQKSNSPNITIIIR